MQQEYLIAVCQSGFTHPNHPVKPGISREIASTPTIPRLSGKMAENSDFLLKLHIESKLMGFGSCDCTHNNVRVPIRQSRVADLRQTGTVSYRTSAKKVERAHRATCGSTVHYVALLYMVYASVRLQDCTILYKTAPCTTSSLLVHSTLPYKGVSARALPLHKFCN